MKRGRLEILARQENRGHLEFQGCLARRSLEGQPRLYQGRLDYLVNLVYLEKKVKRVPKEELVLLVLPEKREPKEKGASQEMQELMALLAREDYRVHQA